MKTTKPEMIFLKPAFVEKIWGSQKLKTLYDFALPTNTNIGEAWLISAHENGMSYVSNGPFHGYSLKQLYTEQPQLFGFPKTKEFPLLTKILDANDNLSVQIHPDDAYAEKHHHTLGKTECWYVLDCQPNQMVVYGHNAKTKTQLNEWLHHNQFNKLLSYQPIKKGDFLYVPAKKIHGILAGTVVFELQQSSDITYRLYDYDRVDNHGKPRELHLQASADNIVIPDVNTSNANGHDNYLVDNEFFKLIKIFNQGTKTYSYPQAPWMQVTVLQGHGTLDHQTIKLGDSFILPAGYNQFTLQGDMLLMASYA